MFAHHIDAFGVADAGRLGDHGHVLFPLGIEQAHPQPAPDLAAQGRHDPQGRLVHLQQLLHQGDRFGALAGQQGIAHLQARGGVATDQGGHGRGRDRGARAAGFASPGVEGELLQFTRKASAVAADRLGQGLGCCRLNRHTHVVGRAAHQLHLAGPVPDRWQVEAAFLGQALERFGGAQARIWLGAIHQHQVAVVGDLAQVCLQLAGQVGRALVAKGAALQQHHPVACPQGRRAGLGQGLGRLGLVVAIEAGEVDALPAGVADLLDQGVYGPGAGRFVIPPEEMDRHRRAPGCGSPFVSSIVGCLRVWSGRRRDLP